MALKLEPGATVAHYRLVRFLGKGGYGEVWEAASGGLRVAVKFMHVEDDLDHVELRSLELLRNVRHANLVEYHFADLMEGSLVIAMSLCDGSLMDRLKQCKAEGLPGLPVDELANAISEAAKAIDFLNEPRHAGADGKKASIIHRDVKPHNLLTVGGSVRVADFGLARMLERSVSVHSGGMTPAYAAPEMVKGQLTPFSDQYALAVTYYQLRLGRLPFIGNHANILYQHLNGEPDWTGLTEEERVALSVAMAKDPQKRWENCRRFSRELQGATASISGGPGSSRSGSTASFVTMPPIPPTPTPKLPKTEVQKDTEPKSAQKAETAPVRRPMPPHLQKRVPGQPPTAPKPPPPPPMETKKPKRRWRWFVVKWLIILGLPTAGGWWLSDNWRRLLLPATAEARSAHFRVVGLSTTSELFCNDPGVEIRIEDKTIRRTQAPTKGMRRELPLTKGGKRKSANGLVEYVREFDVNVADVLTTPKITLKAKTDGRALPDRVVNLRPGENPTVDYGLLDL